MTSKALRESQSAAIRVRRSRFLTFGFWAFHLSALAITLGAAFATTLLYDQVTAREPARGYTPLGLTLGIAASLLYVCAALYTFRKRAGQEFLPVRLQVWLRVHFWISLAGFWAVALHAGFHLDGGTGSWTAGLLLLTILSGVGGWTVYWMIPGQVYEAAGNLAIPDTIRRLQQTEEEMEDELAGRSAELKQYAAQLQHGEPSPSYFVDAEEQRIAERVHRLNEQRDLLTERLTDQRQLRFWLRSWLWIHIPASCAFLIFMVIHVVDAMEVNWVFRTATPADYAAPQSCASCHQQQYDEWIGSMHAIAQASPVTDLQNRLVLLKEEKDLQDGIIQQPVVGNLCVKCHAPTGSLGDESAQEDPLIAISDRAPASQFGVSCVSCHQIDAIHPGDAESDANELSFKNAENLHWTQGRTMLGQIGNEDEDELPSIGNSEHKGVFGAHFKDSSFCASCHTVVVDDPITNERIVKLQDTYTEWRDGGETVNWSTLGAECLNCHGRDLSELADLARQWQSDREPLEERLEQIQQELLRVTTEPLEDPFSASRSFEFDLPLPPRRRFLHTFTGVDYHLEKSLPYLDTDEHAADNERVQAQTLKFTQDLLRIASAIRIKEQLDEAMTVEVLNLATGHHLPAGFAFAREMWIEVAVSDKVEGDEPEDWHILIGGGAENKPLDVDEKLNKLDPSVRNFQAVLYDGVNEKETVLQNEATDVLFGQGARDAGFSDRQQFLLPGEIRTLEIELPENWLEFTGSPTRRLRARLLFRNYPPEFIEELGRRFKDDHGDLQNAERANQLLPSLRIHEMTQDIVILGG